jgi:hypothetical protein
MERTFYRERQALTYASLPVALRLYLPEPWANDEERRRKAGVPADIAFQTKPQIASIRSGRQSPLIHPRVSCLPMPAMAMTRLSAAD